MSSHSGVAVLHCELLYLYTLLCFTGARGLIRCGAMFSFMAIMVYTLMVKYEIAVGRQQLQQPDSTKKVPMIPKI